MRPGNLYKGRSTQAHELFQNWTSRPRAVTRRGQPITILSWLSREATAVKAELKDDSER
jgi:hypothetical protein